MRISIVVAIMLTQISFASASLADDAKMAVTPSKIALDFVSTVFFDRKADRVVDFCHADAKQHRKLEGGDAVAAHLQKTISQLPAADELRLKHLHVFRKSDITADFLKTVMPTVVEADLVASFKPFTDAMQDGFCCIVVFDIVKGSRVRPYMFTFAFAPHGSSYKISLMDEGAPG